MSGTWGRDSDAGRWPTRWPIRTGALLLVAAVAALTAGAYRYTQLTPLQQLYLPTYVRSQTAAAMGFKAGTYQFIHAVNQQGVSRFALEEELEPAADGFALTAVGWQVGDRRLEWLSQSLVPASVYAHLRRWVYGGQTLLALTVIPLCVAAALFTIGIWFTVPRDVQALRARRQGVRRRGPELLPDAATFNARVRGHRWFGDKGIGIQIGGGTVTRLNLRGGIRLPPGAQYRHLAVFGSPGAGKSSLFRQLLLQIRQRGERAVVWDAAMEFTRELYDESHGDQIVTPNDLRSPYWALGDEITTEFDADTLAEAFFPHQHRSNEFFTHGPRQICAYLLRFRPSASQLRTWLSDERELDRLLDEYPEGRSIAHIVSRRSGPQRAGVLASLNMIAKSLALIPDETDTRRRWSTAAWATKRTGWLFISSTPMTRARLTPLLSAWIDMLILRTMTRPDQRGRHQPPAVWFMLDEFASLQRLQQAQTALAEGRKSRNPIVFGLQSRSQLDASYGQLADSMIACTGTQVYFRTPEPNTAEWVSKAFGQIEAERVRESWSEGRGRIGWPQRTESLDRGFEPLVMASQISGLPNMHGLLKFNDVALPIQIPYVDLPAVAPDFVPRPDSPLLVTPPAPSPVDPGDAPNLDWEWVS